MEMFFCYCMVSSVLFLLLLGHPHVMGMSFYSRMVSSVLLLLGHPHIMGMFFCYCMIFSIIFIIIIIIILLIIYVNFFAHNFFRFQDIITKLSPDVGGLSNIFISNDFFI